MNYHETQESIMNYHETQESIALIKENMKSLSTDDLLKIWIDNDRIKWRDETFQVIKDLLKSRQVYIPPQNKNTHSVDSNKQVTYKNYVLYLIILFGIIIHISLVVVKMNYQQVYIERNSVIFGGLLTLNIISSAVCSIDFNKYITLPLSHPVFLFFKLLFSKIILLPPIFFVTGLFIGKLLEMLFYKSYSYYSVFLSIKLMIFLYILGIAGAYVGIFFINYYKRR